METGDPSKSKIVPLLGDRFIILSDRYVKTDGLVYYRDENLVRILPQGVSDRLYDFPIVRVPRFGFDPEIGVQKYYRVKEADFDTFVEQQDLQAGTYVETFTADGEPRGVYYIKSVDVDEDSAIFQEIKDGDEVGAPFPLVFDGYGIPRGSPFDIIRPREKAPEMKEEEVPATDAEGLLGKEQAEEEAATPADAVAAAAAVPTVAESDADGGVVEAAAGTPEEFDLEVLGYVLVPKVEMTKVVPQGQRLYSDAVQKGDALQDFTNMLSLKQQQDLKELRRIRILTETLFALKQDITEYSADGTRATAVPTSANTIMELIERVPVPLGRPVLDTEINIYELSPASDEDGAKSFILRDFNDKTIMVRGVSSRVLSAVETAYKKAARDGLSEEERERAVAEAAALEQSGPAQEEGAIDDPINIVDLREELDQIRGFIGSAVASRPLTTTMQFWINMQSFMETFGRPWRPAASEGTESIETWSPIMDSEFFRAQMPSTTERSVRGIRPDKSEKPDQLFVGKLYFSIGRALKETNYTLKSKQRAVLFNAESAPLKGYLLFPIQYKSALGTSRSGFLVQDVVNSQAKPKQMSGILRELGGIQDEAKSGEILAIGANTSGNIEVAEYLRHVALTGFGPADMMRELSHLGLNMLELNLAQAEVVNGKVADYVNRVRAYVAKIRERLAATQAAPPATDPLFAKEDINWLFTEAIAGEPILATYLAEFTKQSSQLAQSDYAVLSYLIVKNLDYLLAAAGKNEMQIARELLRATRKNFLTMLRAAITVRDAPRGQAPKPNLCPHVNKLRDIRRIDDTTERYKEMVRFLVKFQGPRNGNYVQCAACNKELLCVHELLELKIFMNPREREPLHKELLLNFSGPVMGNTYQCRNCGQPLGTIDYDNSMEFDDQGRPMVGYAALPADEAKQLDELDKLLGAQDAAAPTGEDFGSDKNNYIYSVIKELADRIGVYPTKTDYTMIIGNIKGVLSDIGDRAQFVAQQEELRAQAKLLGKTVRLPDYEIVVNRSLVAAAGAYLLIHVQTKIPDYMPTVSVGGCKNPGFRGWPLDSEENRQGQEYVACVISTIMRNAEPWNMTGFQAQPIEAKRQKMIFDRIGDVITDALDKPEIQLLLAAKRKYRSEIYGESGQIAESVSRLFLPPQKQITGLDAVQTGTTIMEGVKTAKTLAARSDYWIQIANIFTEKLALERGDVIVGNPFAETTTAFGPIAVPQAGLADAPLPALDERKLQPGALASRVMPRFMPRPMSELLASAPEGLYYVLFLKVCYEGPRYGLPHESGLTHKCPHCQFQFPGPIALMDVEKEGKAALEAQKVEVNQETFKALLNAMHDRYAVAAFVKKQPKAPFENLRDVATIEPEPTPGWAALIEKLIVDLQALPPDATGSDILQTLTPISQVAMDAKAEISSRLKKRFADELFGLMDYAPNEVAEMINAYFIVPMNRLVNNFDASSLHRLQPHLAEELAPNHISAIESEVLAKATSIQAELQSKIAKAPFARSKFAHCVKQLRSLMPVLQRINATNIPGGQRTLKYLVPAMILQPFAQLINPNIIPTNAEDGGGDALDNSVMLIISFLNKALVKCNNENITFTDTDLKSELQVAAEKEKMVIIKDFDSMTEDEKRVELMKKQLGIGPKWSRGGSKQVRLYNKDIWEAERIERIRAGRSDFGGGTGPDGLTEEAVAMGDANGIYNADGDGPYEDTGYDMDQMGEEDF